LTTTNSSDQMREQTRRAFLASVGGAVGAGLLPGAALAQQARRAPAAGTVVLFQGDSITDAGRDRAAEEPNRANGLGNGYPFLIAAAAQRDHPGRDLRFFNRGISGNRVPDLDARWETDAVALRPDVLSILIGVNDIWHKLNGRYAGTVEQYESGLGALLQRTRAALPTTRLVLMEPFVLRVGAVDARWFPEFDQRRAAAERVAERVGATWVPLQEMFDRLARETAPEHWAADGVHPTLAGHAAIAQRWREMVGI
jgi:lysophospholipase L1-like esterase